MGFLACIGDICVLDMKVIIIDQTPKFKHTAENLGEHYAPPPRKLTKATPGGVKVNLADKIIFSYY